MVFESKVNEPADRMKNALKTARLKHGLKRLGEFKKQFAPKQPPAVLSGIKRRAEPIAPALAASRVKPSPSLRTPLEPEAFFVFFNSLSL